MSEPATIKATTAPLAVVTTELEATDGETTGGLTKDKSFDVKYVAFPKGASLENQKLDLAFDLASDDYYLWCEYSPRHTKGRQMVLQLDGQEFGYWTTHQPWRLNRDREIRPGEERWLVERVVAAKDRWGRNPRDKATLKAGKHMLTVIFPGEKAGQTPWISKFLLTNDASFRAPGYSPQFRFNTLRRQK